MKYLTPIGSSVSRAGRIFLFLLTMAWSLSSLNAQTWTGTTSTNWAIATNWSTGVVPTPADDVVIPSTGISPVIMNGTAALARSVMVESGGALTINAGGSLNMDGNPTTVLFNQGTIANGGTISIGATTGGAQYGLVNQGVFNNNSGGAIRIDRTTSVGLAHSMGTFSNVGKISIGGLATPGTTGLYLQASFNNSGGEINIDRSVAAGIDLQSGTLTNAGKINIGQLSGAVSSAIYSGSAIINGTTGVINIDRGYGAIFNRPGSSFINAGKINIGQTAHINGPGIYNFTNFSNSATGEIKIDSAGTGIFNVAGGMPFVNAGKIKIGQTGPISGPAIYSFTVFTNTSTGEVLIDRSYTGFHNALGSSLTNTGKISIGQLAQLGGPGIYNLTLVNNNVGGEIRLDRSNTGIQDVAGSSFTNAGQIWIGQLAKMNNLGIYSEAEFNNSGGITIDSTMYTGIHHRTGIFTNTGSLKIGTSTSIGGVGLYNEKTFYNDPGSSLVIDRTSESSTALYITNNAAFINMTTITIGSTVRAGTNGIYNAGRFDNRSGSMISIDRISFSFGNGLFNNDDAIFYNSGIITIGSAVSAGTQGLVNAGTFSNSSSGQIRIEHISTYSTNTNGLYNTSGATFTNGGQLSIGSTTTAGNHGLLNGGTFDNGGEGELTIDHVVSGENTHGIYNSSGSVFSNKSKLYIGSTFAGAWGIYNTSTFDNYNGGEIHIDHVTNTALRHDGGVFTNAGQLYIGDTDLAGDWGLWTQAAFNNSASGEITIVRTVLAGLRHTSNTFTNSGKITLRTATVSSWALWTSAPFNNAACASLLLFDPLQNSSTFTNSGLLTSRTPLAHVNSALTNNGIIEYPNGNPIPNVTNNDLIVQPISGECAIANALTIGGANSFTAASTWYKNAALTVPAGTYNAGTNTFSSTSLTVGANLLYFSAQDNVNNCAKTVSIAVTYHDNTAPTVTCQSASVNVNAAGTASITTADVFQSGTDNCGTVNQQSVSPNAFTCANLGSNLVTLTVNDGHSNTATCTTTVTVNDNLNPTVVCKNATVNLSAAGSGSITTADVFQSGADNCGIVNQVSVTPNTFSCSSLGANTVTLTVNDGHSNTATCSATVTVVDNMSPTIVCKNATVNVNAAGTGSITTADVFQSGTDNCGTVNQVSVTPNTFNCSNLGGNVVTLTANDGHGNTATCSAMVTVNDNLAPTVVCKNASVNLNAAGTASITTADVFQSGADNCGTVNQVSVTPNTFNCNSLGTSTVTLTVNDGHSNTGSCTAVVTVVDNAPPTVLCKNATVNLNAAGNGTLATADVFQSGSDNCGTVNQISVTPNMFNCSNLGTTTVTLLVNDGHSNTASCSATVSIVDAIAPTVVCKTFRTGLNAAGTVTVTTADVFVSGADNCGIVNQVSVLPNTFDCSNIGTSTVVLTVNDGHGNTGTCTTTVKVNDNLSPNLVCKNATVNLSAVGAGSITTADVFQSSSDNCGTVNLVSVLPNTFSCGSLGSNVVILQANDGHSNTGTCTSTITVVDNIAPTVVCQPVTVNLNGSGSGAVTTAQVFQSGADNCGVVNQVSVTPSSFTCSNVGTNTVVLVVNDSHGNTASCSAIVTVRDITAPTVACVAPFTINLNAAGTATITAAQINNGSSDPCGLGALTITPSTFGCANLGSNVVTLRATDPSNNSSTCTTVVTVRDLLGPTALCKNITVQLDDNGQATITPASINNGTNDPCGVASVSINTSSFACLDLNTARIVVLTARDNNGNTSTCSSTVTTKDAIAPTAVCQDVTVALNAQGKAIVTAAMLTTGSYDNCSVWSYVPATKIYAAANLGVNSLSILVKDYSGNGSTCVSQVTVVPFGTPTSFQTGNKHQQILPGVNPDEKLTLVVYPNPTERDVTVVFQLDKAQAVDLRLFDLTGRLLLHEKTGGSIGENIVPLELGSWPSGVYLLEVQSESQQAQQRLMIQRD